MLLHPLSGRSIPQIFLYSTKPGEVQSYHPAHVSRLLKAIKYSVQQPIERATQRDEQAIKTWKEERWPALKKSPAGRQNDHFRR